MKSEIEAAVIFLTRLVKKNQKLTEEQVEDFSKRLIDLLGDKFKNHWYQDDPEKGQAYRCIRMNETVTKDPVIEQAATDSGLVYGDLRLPTELTVWVDPKEVCCRFGENKGSWCTLFKEGSEDSQVIEKVLDQAQVKNGNRPIEVTRINQRSGTPSPPFTQSSRGPHQFYGNSNNSNINAGPQGRNFHHNHNHNNNTTLKFKPFPQGKFRQPPPPLPKKHSVSPTFVKGNKMAAPASPPKSFKAQHPQFQQHVSTSRNDRFHWVRGADLVKA